MRINPIQSIDPRVIHPQISRNTTVSTPASDGSLIPAFDNYGRSLVFKGFNPLKKAVLNSSFEDKLAVALGRLRNTTGTGNLLLVAKDMEGLKQLVAKLDTPVPIRRLLLMTEPQLKGSLFFVQNQKRTTLINTNGYDLINGNLDAIPPGHTIDVEPDMFFRNNLGWFEIKEQHESDLDLERHSHFFLQELDYSKDFDKLALNHNKEIIKFITEIDKVEPVVEKKKAGLTFDSIGGQDEVIESLKKNVLFPLRYPDVFEGFMMSRGVILYGPPGTGKTLLAKTLGVESGASVFELCATDLSDKYVGESEKNCRELFAKAVDAQPSIIYFDEIDALGKARGKDTYGDKLLTQFLSLMSDIEKRGDNVYVIGSTNRKEDLDPAFTRSGRFSTLLEVKAPDLKGTKQILEIHTKGKSIDKDVDLDNIAEKMYAKRMTGADIAATVKEAFSHALERTGIYNSMSADTYSPAMKDFLTINTADFVQSIDEYKNNSIKWAPVGFRK